MDTIATLQKYLFKEVDCDTKLKPGECRALTVGVIRLRCPIKGTVNECRADAKTYRCVGCETDHPLVITRG